MGVMILACVSVHILDISALICLDIGCVIVSDLCLCIKFTGRIGTWILLLEHKTCFVPGLPCFLLVCVR